MFFASDNGAGASPKILEAVTKALSAAPVMAYGADDLTKRAEQKIAEIFERDVAVFFLTSGTATNALALAHVTPPWGAVYSHHISHANATECGAGEFYGQMKFVPLPGEGGKLLPAAIDDRVRGTRIGDAHHCQPATITLTNLTECGTLYRPAEIAAISEVAKRHKLTLHLDGARFSNALVASGATPAEMTWKVGIDVMSLGATKNGAIAAEAVIFFDKPRADGFIFRRMRGGHLTSKMRFISAQFDAWLSDAHFLDLARHANGMAARLAAGLAGLGVKFAWPVQGNEVFPVLDTAAAERVRATGLAIHTWPAEYLAEGTHVGPHQQVCRLICSFTTPKEDVDGLIALVGGAMSAAKAAE